MSKYTDEDVVRLVNQAESVLRAIRCGKEINPDGGYQYILNEAIAPFRPDPEEELIEAMARADWTSFNSSIKGWDEAGEYMKEKYLNASRAILTVIKEKGYFNGQR